MQQYKKNLDNNRARKRYRYEQDVENNRIKSENITWKIFSTNVTNRK